MKGILKKTEQGWGILIEGSKFTPLNADSILEYLGQLKEGNEVFFRIDKNIADMPHSPYHNKKTYEYEVATIIGIPEDTMISLNAVDSILELTKNYGLESEVIVWALKYMKEDPTITISESIIMGYNEWVK